MAAAGPENDSSSDEGETSLWDPRIRHGILEIIKKFFDDRKQAKAIIKLHNLLIAANAKIVNINGLFKEKGVIKFVYSLGKKGIDISNWKQEVLNCIMGAIFKTNVKQLHIQNNELTERDFLGIYVNLPNIHNIHYFFNDNPKLKYPVENIILRRVLSAVNHKKINLRIVEMREYLLTIPQPISLIFNGIINKLMIAFNLSIEMRRAMWGVLAEVFSSDENIQLQFDCIDINNNAMTLKEMEYFMQYESQIKVRQLKHDKNPFNDDSPPIEYVEPPKSMYDDLDDLPIKKPSAKPEPYDVKALTHQFAQLALPDNTLQKAAEKKPDMGL